MAEQRDSGIGIAELLKELRKELDTAESEIADAGKGAKLFLEASEIELAFTVSRSTEVGGGLNFNVFGVGAGVNAKDGKVQQSVHRIKLSLRPSAGDIGIARIPK